MKDLERYRGCLLGGAAGDALGYPVEFLSRADILMAYGPGGITEYTLSGGSALISDDTQMTLFTANGLLFAETRRRLGAPGGGSMTGAVAACYRDWLQTQQEPYPLSGRHTTAWLIHIPALFHRRAPGATCLEAIGQGCNGTIEHPANQSKGCGGIMRIAPAGLWLSTPSGAGLLAAQLAALTHGHELGYIPAGLLGYCICALAHREAVDVLEAVRKGLDWAVQTFSSAQHLPKLIGLVEKAIRLSNDDLPCHTAIRQLGEGWVAEEALAIAVYCAVKYEDGFNRALIASVNHDGDSDSTGALTGNLLGARLGLSGIPAKYLEHLECKSVILELADDLWQGVPAAYQAHIPPMVHVAGTPKPEAVPLTPEAALWDAKYNTAVYGGSE